MRSWTLRVRVRNKELLPTSKKGRSSALKDNLGNAYAGGRGNEGGAAECFGRLAGRATISHEQLVEMMAEIGTTTPREVSRGSGGELVLSSPGCFHSRTPGTVKYLLL